MTPYAVTAYLHCLVEDGYRTSTIQRRLSTIAVCHRAPVAVAALYLHEHLYAMVPSMRRQVPSRCSAHCGGISSVAVSDQHAVKPSNRGRGLGPGWSSITCLRVPAGSMIKHSLSGP